MQKKKSFKIIPYHPSMQSVWDAFVMRSKNGTFLLQRSFMDYHQQRFIDYSLCFFDQEELIAVLPAHRVGEVLYSHQGLTYGGILIQSSMKTAAYITLFTQLLQYLQQQQIVKLVLKKTPNFYHQGLSEEIDYMAFVTQASCTRVDTCSVIQYSNYEISSSKKRDALKAKKEQFLWEEVEDLSYFWGEILTKNLEQRYQTQPVHTYQEIRRLKDAFPQQIRFFQIAHQDQIIGATVLFIHSQVVHVQYISSLAAYKSSGALDLLFYELIAKFEKTHAYFDFGTSNEQQGTKINAGLMQWKEAFGARTAVQSFYEFSTSSWTSLETLYDL